MNTPDIAAVEVYEYPESGKARPCFWEALSDFAPGAATKPLHGPTEGSQAKSKTNSGPIEDASRQAFELGREQGVREGLEQERALQKARIQEIETRSIAQAAKLTRQFAQKQEEFLDVVEQDLVHLALAIAERILRREAQIDPLFLVGAVRVALGQLAKSMRVRLRVPAADAELWKQTMSHIPNLKVRPEVIPDQAMQPGDCMIESEMGSVDLGLPAQLHTIRQTLLDNPSGAPNSLVSEPKLQNEGARS